MKILLTGASGQLGLALQKTLPPKKLLTFGHADLDITNRSSVFSLVNEHKPDWIINCAAYNLVDEAEEETEQAFRVNSLGALHLAKAAESTNASLVHFSTDYIFDGQHKSPYRETDAPRPLSMYGASKLQGEFMVQLFCPKHFVIRTCGLYGQGSVRQGENFIDQMFQKAQRGETIKVVEDQILTPTSCRELAEKVIPLIKSGKYGLYHMTNTGQCSWYEFAQEIFQISKLSPALEPVSSSAFNAKAKRPRYSVLDNMAYREAGFEDFRPWQEALRDYLEESKT